MSTPRATAERHAAGAAPRRADVGAAIAGLARVPRRVSRADIAIVAGLLVWALLEAVLAGGPGSRAERVLLAVAFSVPLAQRRRRPLAVLAIVACAAIVRATLGGVPEQGAMPIPSLLLASFSAALYARPRWSAWAALPVPFAGLLASFGAFPNAANLVTFAAISAGAWGAGWLIRRRADQLGVARTEGEQRAREAVLAERAKMARELHDVVAHSVTLISVQSGAAQALAGQAPQQARAHLQAVHRAASEALVELRRLVGLLRDDDPGAAARPGLGRLHELVAQARAAGLPTALELEGPRARLPEALGLTAYRIVQESLTNVRRHAGAADTVVRVRHAPDRLELEIANASGQRDGALGGASGRGLAGMRERVRQHGGTLDSGPAPGGGYVVRASLPLPPAGAPPARSGAAGTSVAPPRVPALARLLTGVSRTDVAIAGALLVWALLEALLVAGPAAPAVRVGLAVGYAAPIVVRRRWPLEGLAVVCALFVAGSALTHGQQDVTMPLPVLLLGAYSVALHARPARRALAAPPLLVVAIAAATAVGDFAGGFVDVAIVSAFALGAWGGGRLVRRRSEQLARERARAPLLARDAVAGERARLARELHDVVAHSITVTSLQAGAAEGLLERDPALAREHLQAIHAAAHEALVELRRLVGVLREDDDAPRAPQPGLDRLDELVAQTQAAGVPVTLAREGERRPLAPGLELAAYRIVQESLTNVRRHAGTAQSRVTVRYREDRLELEVVNAAGAASAAAGAGSGRGLVGMRERARLYGGTLAAAPTDDGGFAVRARLPLEPAP